MIAFTMGGDEVRTNTVMLLAIFAATSLSGCAGKMQWVKNFEAATERQTASRECVKAGWAIENPRHEECIQNTVIALREQQRIQAERDRENLAGLLILGAAGYGASQEYSAPSPQQALPPNTGQTSFASPSQSSVGGQATMRLCPNGSYVYGTECRLAPNGQYLPGPATLAPNGQYVTGRPQIAPDGTYVGGNGPVRICPDGSYVSGSRCILTPDGSYVGAP